MSSPDHEFARHAGAGFVALMDADGTRGWHFVRAAHITAIRNAFDKDDLWLGCDVWLVDGSRRRVNASFEQIASAIEGGCK